MAYALTNEELICNGTGRFESRLNELLKERLRKGGKRGAGETGCSEGCRPRWDMGSLLLVSDQDPRLLWSLSSTSLLSTGLPLMGMCP